MSDMKLHQYVYVGQNTHTQELARYEISALKWLEQAHLEAAKNIFTPKHIYLPDDKEHNSAVQYEDWKDDIQQFKKANVKIFLASAFNTLEEPQTPETSSRKISQNGGVLRDYIVLDYDIDDVTEANQLLNSVNQRFVKDQKINFGIYPSIKYPIKPRFRLIVEVDKLLDKYSYKQAAKILIETLGVDTHDLVANQTIAHNFNAPAYTSDVAVKQAYFQTDGKPLNLEMYGYSESDVKRPKKKEESIAKTVQFRDEQLDPAIKAFIADDRNKEKLKDYDFFWRFAESLADARIKNLISDDFVNTILKATAYGNSEWEENNPQVYNTQLEKLTNDASKRAVVKPLSSYLPIVSQVQQRNPNIKNLSQLLQSLLPADFEGDPETPVKDTADLISQFFEFGLLPNAQDDVNALAIFNPLTGLWTHNVDDFIAMISLVKPALSNQQLNSILMYWAASARHKLQIIKPYTGSQYLVFTNGVLDILTMDLHPLSSDIVKEKQFIMRHQIQIDYDAAAKLKVFKEDGMNGSDWDIDKFINAYSNNNQTIRTYLLFGLSLGLFAGHNSGVHFDIQGESGSGKSTLATIFRALFGSSQVAEILFSDLNKDFPVTSYDLNTSIIWIKESNIGTKQLDDDYGTPFYDGLADGQARIPVKHAGDLIISEPPQVYVDGTQLIQSEEINSGPARRTLPFKLPNPIAPLRDQFYSNNIFERLNDVEVLQYLVNEMIKAFKEIVPENRQPNFKMNLGVKSDEELLPHLVLDWRKDLLSTSDTADDWFDDMIEPSLMLDDTRGYINYEMLMKLYQKWYEVKNGNNKYMRSPKRIQSDLEKIFVDRNMYLIDYNSAGNRNRRRISFPNAWGFSWKVYDESYIRPPEFNDDPSVYMQAWPDLYSRYAKNLFRVVTNIPDPNKYQKTANGHFIPLGTSTEIEGKIDNGVPRPKKGGNN